MEQSKFWQVKGEIVSPQEVPDGITFIGMKDGSTFIEMNSRKERKTSVAKKLNIKKEQVEQCKEADIPYDCLPLFGSFIPANHKRAQTKGGNRAKRIRIAAETADDKSNDELFLEFEKNGEDENLIDFENIISRICKRKQIDIRKDRKEKARRIVWKPWQQRIIDIINQEPDDRKIYVVLDPNGNTGKSFLSRNYGILYNNKILELRGGTKADMLYLASQKALFDTVFIDVARKSEVKDFSYDAVEELKNGSYISTKYKCKHIDNRVPHIFLFMNNVPDFAANSLDRWIILFINKQQELIEVNYMEDIHEKYLLNEMSNKQLYDTFETLRK